MYAFATFHGSDFRSISLSDILNGIDERKITRKLLFSTKVTMTKEPIRNKKLFIKTKKDLAKHILSIKTWEEFDAFLAGLGAEHLKKQIPNAMKLMFGKTNLDMGSVKP